MGYTGTHNSTYYLIHSHESVCWKHIKNCWLSRLLPAVSWKETCEFPSTALRQTWRSCFCWKVLTPHLRPHHTTESTEVSHCPKPVITWMSMRANPYPGGWSCTPKQQKKPSPKNLFVPSSNKDFFWTTLWDQSRDDLREGPQLRLCNWAHLLAVAPVLSPFKPEARVRTPKMTWDHWTTFPIPLLWFIHIEQISSICFSLYSSL